MKTGVIQLNSSDQKTQNIQKAVHFVNEAINKEADFIALPEVFNFRGRLQTKDQRQRIAEKIPGESILPFMALAKLRRVFILCGSIYEKIPGSDKMYNTSVLIDPKGEIKAVYRKMHLFQAVIQNRLIKEAEIFRAGEEFVMSRIGQFRLGLSICYDLRFPELYRRYAREGGHLLCVPSAFTKATGESHFETLLKARAIENLCYVLAPNQTGKDARGLPSFGHSMIIDPWGRVLAKASADKEEVIFAQLSLSELKQKRAIWLIE